MNKVYPMRDKKRTGVNRSHSQIDILVQKNEELSREISELRETAAVQSSLYEIAELHSAIYRIADLTNNATDMRRFGELLHGAIKELVNAADTLLIAEVDPLGPITWQYRGGRLFEELPDNRDGSILSELVHTDIPFILNKEGIARITESGRLSPDDHVTPTVIASAPFGPQGTEKGTVILAGFDTADGDEGRLLNMAVFIARQIGMILERKLMHEVLTRSRDELETAVRDRAAEIIDTNERLTKEIAVREDNERLRSALLSITDCASDTLSPEELCREIHAITGSVLYAPNFSVALCDGGSMLLQYIYFSDEHGLTDPSENRFFTAMNRYILGMQKASFFQKDAFPKNLTASASDILLPESWIGSPLKLGGPAFGVVSLHSYSPQRLYTEKELDALSAIAPQIASTLDRAMIHGKLRRYQIELESRVADRTRDLQEANKSLQSIINLTVDVLSSASEIRDPYTAGHQKRVTKIALRIAEEMKLSDDQKESIRIAATLHDFGKIAVPIEILTKPGTLTGLEREFVHTHSQAGYDILNIIPFKGPIAEIVRQHHEKLDGSGYPQGLEGPSILLEAKVITVADVVEAISSHRPYRASLGMPAAVMEIGANSGLLYDPDVVNAFITVLKNSPDDFL